MGIDWDGMGIDWDRMGIDWDGDGMWVDWDGGVGRGWGQLLFLFFRCKFFFFILKSPKEINSCSFFGEFLHLCITSLILFLLF